MSDISSKEDDQSQRIHLFREALPECQPQEGSPANTFTSSELDQLRAVLRELNLRPQDTEMKALLASAAVMNILNPDDWVAPQSLNADEVRIDETKDPASSPETSSESSINKHASITWFDAPKLKEGLSSQNFRLQVRQGLFTKPTNGQCPGFLQCNLVVLPQGQYAYDFLLFCQRNKKACPLIEVCDVGSPHPQGVALGADLRTDIPKYAIYRDGKLEKEVNDVTAYWPENSVAFLIGCSFSYDGAFLEGGIPLRSAEVGKNVPMYRSNLPCRTAGSLSGNMVVSMKPIKALDIAKEVEITSQYPHAHGSPVCVGNPLAIGITDLNKPDWGEPIDLREDELPVFHACGVTPQSVLMDSKIPFAITHSAGYMFVTDLPSNVVP